ncbi:transglutaminase family protein [Colwellia sp. MEBiC06753]
MTSAKPHFQLSSKHFLQLLLVQLATILLFVQELSGWMLALIGLSLVWQLTRCLNMKPFGGLTNQKIKPTPRLIVVLFALTGTMIIVLYGKSLGLLSSMVHLICFAYAIKSLEIRQRRDFFQLVVIGLFLHACSLIFFQSIWFTLLVVAAVVLNFSLLFQQFAQVDKYSMAPKQVIKLLVFSVPLAIALFILFPRLSPFWQVPLANTAKTGLGSEVKPGDIAQLALSDELAFRVEFSSSAPAKQAMYWRAMTLPIFDDNQWSRGKKESIPNYLLFKPDISELSGLSYDYQVMAEPSNQSWLFALDTAQTDDQRIKQLSDFSFIYHKPINKTLSYQVTSFINAKQDLELPARFQRFYLRLPDNSNPQLTELGQSLRARFSDNRELINHVLSQFRQQQYFYTLSPPRLNNNSLDQFYFETKSGFCEHYASAFAFLMRAAGIPARLVTGYLGGEYNQQGNYYSIYQYDAHAWTEVWLDGQGWVRVDPTAAVSPDRVSDNMSDALRQEREGLAGQFSWQTLSNLAWLTQIKMQIDAIDYQWNRLVISFSMEKQSKLLDSLFGNGKLWKAALAMFAVFILMVLILWFKEIMPVRQTIPRWQHQFDLLLKQLMQQGFTRTAAQSPVAFAHSVSIAESALKAELKAELINVCQLYQQLLYQPLTVKRHTQLSQRFELQAKRLTRKIKRFKVK